MATKIPSEFSSLEYADEFYKKILAKLGAPITDGNMIFMKAWRQAEGGKAIYNPWNTIQGGYPGATKYNDKPGVKNYTRLEDGIDATYKTITNGIYPNIVAALKKGIKDKTEAYNLAVSLQKQGKDLWAWVRGPYSKSSDLPGYVAAVLAASRVSGRGIPIPLSGAPQSTSTTISGTVKDDKGQPVAGAVVKLSPPSTSSTTATTQEPPDTPFKNSTESDEFRKWLLTKYPDYGAKPKPFNVDSPPQKSTNSIALRKAWAEKGTEYNIANLKFASSEEVPDILDEPVEAITDENGNWVINASTTFDPRTSTFIFSKEGHEPREIKNIQQTGGDVTGDTGKQYDLSRITIAPTPDPTNTVTSRINQDILNEETKIIKQQGNSELSAQEKIANAANNQKEELKKTAIPFVVKLLLPFGAVALQAIVSKIPLDKIKDQILCPNQNKLLELINKRNKLVKQINNTYKTINTLTKALSITSTAVTAIQAGITLIEAAPYPSIGIPPLGLPPLTSGVIETTGSGKDKLKEALKKANVVISIVTVALASFGAVLGVILGLLNGLDVLIQQCTEEQDVPFETINNELNNFVNQSTGISNSDTIQAIQEDNTYKGFTLEIKLDNASNSKYPRRFAQALTKQGIPVLKTDSSFVSDAQVLIDQLKFIIDSNPQLTAE